VTDDFAGYAAVRRAITENIERSRLLCENHGSLRKDLAAQRDRQAAVRKQDRTTAEQR